MVVKGYTVGASVKLVKFLHTFDFFSSPLSYFLTIHSKIFHKGMSKLIAIEVFLVIVPTSTCMHCFIYFLTWCFPFTCSSFFSPCFSSPISLFFCSSNLYIFSVISILFFVLPSSSWEKLPNCYMGLFKICSLHFQIDASQLPDAGWWWYE